ncbi:hypothetical protein CCP4SC76_7640010 [Gammaproteobacteria bacterium]
MFKRLKKFLNAQNDPVKNCEVYLDKEAGSCCHVDGPHCDMEDCEIRFQYHKEERIIIMENNRPGRINPHHSQRMM